MASHFARSLWRSSKSLQRVLSSPPVEGWQSLSSFRGALGLRYYQNSFFSSFAAEKPSTKSPPQYDTATKRKILVNRLLYRSQQRGFLEMDLLLGLWAKEHVPQAPESLLAAFEGMLDLENPDLFKWLTGQEQPPSELEQNIAFQEVRKDIGAQLRGVVDSAARTKPGKDWLRGWDDWKKGQQQPQKIE